MVSFLISGTIILFFCSPYAIYREWYWLGAVGYGFFLLLTLCVILEDIEKLIDKKLEKLKTELLKGE